MSLAAAIAALMAVGQPAPLAPGRAPGHGVERVATLGEMRGLSPTAVRARLSGRDGVPSAPGLVALWRGRPIQVIGLSALVAGPASAGRCNGKRDLSLVFGPDGLMGALDRAPRLGSGAAPASVVPLPFEEGLDGLLARTDLQAPPDQPLRVTCLSAADIEANRARNRASRKPQPFDTAGTLQGLALVPFAIFASPMMAADDRRAVAQGARTLALLHLGQRPPGGLQAMAKRPGVKVLVGLSDGYAVLRIDIGRPPKGNLAPMHQYAQAGVRHGLVGWIDARPPSSGLGFLPPP